MVWWHRAIDNASTTGNSNIDGGAAIATDTADGSYYDENDQRGRRPAKKFTQIYNLPATIMFCDNVEKEFESDDNLYNVEEWHPKNANSPDPTGYLEILRHQLGMNSAWGDGSVTYFKADESGTQALAKPGGSARWYSGGDPDNWWAPG